MRNIIKAGLIMFGLQIAILASLLIGSVLLMVDWNLKLVLVIGVVVYNLVAIVLILIGLLSKEKEDRVYY